MTKEEAVYIGDFEPVMSHVKWFVIDKMIDSCRRHVKVKVTIEVTDPEEGDVDNVDL